MQQRLADRIGELDVLAVDTTAQGRGIGCNLLRTAEAMLATRGTTQLIAQVRSTSALQWFSRRGFTFPSPNKVFAFKFEGHFIGIDALSVTGYRQGYKPLH
ncbi:acetyltransferase (GNAT) family protein [Streptomyces noursei ATCC 11455]|nr:acetyltransferase (GNAT) family protein [Streptomyces noursei ATCC 11455]ANZ21905.1 acetyltransferase (GNAT) family protein [Streptomyces noursei ATCC 11455]